MTPFGGMLSNEELADVLTYVRNSFGNQSPPPIGAQKIEEVRVANSGEGGLLLTRGAGGRRSHGGSYRS